MKKSVEKFLMNTGIVLGIVAILGIVLFLIWNTAIVWMVPSLPGLPYMNAIGISMLCLTLHMLANYWINRFISIRSAKALGALMEMEKLKVDVAYLKKQIKDQNTP